ncbi:MAG: Crp/Fnr family transcriptional regulator [Eubacterium sp.]|nr:Crp/Fnr family transcriptional regulator [Eubacterium sp.]
MDKRLEPASRAFFDKIPEESRRRILNAGYLKSFRKNEIIYGERDEVNSIYIVMNGFVSLYRNSRYGEIKVIFICAKGEMLNEVVVEKEKASVGAKILSDAEILVIPRESFTRLMNQDFELVKGVFHSISSKTRRLFHQVGNNNGTYPLGKHLASKLWKLARDYGIDTDRGKQVSFDVSVTLLANMLGAKRETVSREMSRLKKEGLVIHKNGVLIVTDLSKLHEFV